MAATGALSGAASGAQLGSSFGPYGTAIGAVAGAIFGGMGGSGKQTAQEKFQGYGVEGTFGPSGFSGEVKGNFADGVYTATGETSYLNSLGTKLATAGLAGSGQPGEQLSDSELQDYFAKGGAPIPVSINAGQDVSKLAGKVASFIVGQVRSANSVDTLIGQITGTTTHMQAPDLSTAPAPAGTPTMQTSSPSTTAAAVYSAPSSLLQLISDNPLLSAVAAGLILWWLTKGKG